MTDPRPDANPEPTASTGNPADSEVAPVSGSDRRAFLRQLSGDAVSTAGRLAGFSSIVRRTVVAAGVTVTRGLEASTAEVPEVPEVTDRVVEDMAPAAAPGPSGTTPSAVPPDVREAAAPAPTQGERRDPVLALTAAQHDFLAGAMRATLAVNDPAGPPQLTSSMIHWDGSIVRLPSQQFTARATNVDRDRRVGLLLDDANSGAWVAITGEASIVYGDEAESDTRLILARYYPDDDEAIRRWEEMAASGDRIVIRVRPTRFVWRPA